jgi:hypothetical protein
LTQELSKKHGVKKALILKKAMLSELLENFTVWSGKAHPLVGGDESDTYRK